MLLHTTVTSICYIPTFGHIAQDYNNEFEFGESGAFIRTARISWREIWLGIIVNFGVVVNPMVVSVEFLE